MKFREYELSTGKIIFAGKSATNNEELVGAAGTEDVLLHTKAPGSPFVNVGAKALKKEIKEAAVFCVSKSQDWRDNKGDVVVHVFKKSSVYKKKGMKLGCFGVGKYDAEIVVKKGEVGRLK